MGSALLCYLGWYLLSRIAMAIYIHSSLRGRMQGAGALQCVDDFDVYIVIGCASPVLGDLVFGPVLLGVVWNRAVNSMSGAATNFYRNRYGGSKP